MFIFLTLFRDPLLYQTIPELSLWINGIIYGVVFLLFGWWLFTKNSNEFAYRA